MISNLYSCKISQPKIQKLKTSTTYLASNFTRQFWCTWIFHLALLMHLWLQVGWLRVSWSQMSSLVHLTADLPSAGVMGITGSHVTCLLSSSGPAHACWHDDLGLQEQQERTSLNVKTSGLCLHHICYCSIALSESCGQTRASVFVDSVRALIPARINKLESVTATKCHIFQAIFPLFLLPT